jgi:hypothetical protein
VIARHPAEIQLMLTPLRICPFFLLLLCLIGCRGQLILDESTQSTSLMYASDTTLPQHNSLFDALPQPLRRETIRETARQFVEEFTFRMPSDSPSNTESDLVTVRLYMEESDSICRFRLYYLGNDASIVARLQEWSKAPTADSVER